MADAREAGVDNEAYRWLIQRAQLGQEAERMGIAVSRRAVGQEIRENEAFQNPVTEEFDRETYASTLARNEYSIGEYEDLVRHDLTSNILYSGLTAGVSPPSIFAANRVRLYNEQRIISVINVPEEANPPPGDPSEDDLREIYEANLDALAEPERRTVSVVLFTPDIDTALENVAEDDVERLFEPALAQATIAETRTYVELIANDQDTAMAFAQQLRDGGVPQEITQGVDGATVGIYEGETRTQVLDDAVGETVFSLDIGEVSEPVRTSFNNWAVVRVDSIEEGEEPDADAIRAQVREELANELARREVGARLDAFEQELLNRGAEFPVAAEAAGVPVRTFENIDSSGLTPSGEPAADLPNPTYDAIVAATFEERPGLVSPTRTAGEDIFVLRVEDVEPRRVRAMDEVRENVESIWRSNAASNAHLELAESIQSALNGDAALAQAAAIGGPLVTSDTFMVLRADAMFPSGRVPEGLGRQAANTAFQLNAGDSIILPREDGAYSVVRAEAILPSPPVSARSQDVRAVRSQMISEITNDMLTFYTAGLEARYPARTNPAAFARATGAPTQ